jgi:YfiH family protein
LRERRVPGADVPRYELDDWRKEYGVVAGITGRDDGFDLGLASLESAGSVFGRWQRVRESFGPEFEGLVVSCQVHGGEIGEIDQGFPGLLVRYGLDGHVTRSVGVLLAVTVADCVPVYLLHPESRTLGLLHAGWRGTACGIVENGIDRISERAGTAPGGILMHCGVSICGECYEVGPEVQEGIGGEATSGSSLLDLRANLVKRARSRGLEQATVSDWCTAHDGDRFYSHRASGGRAGRMVAYAGFPCT